MIFIRFFKGLLPKTRERNSGSAKYYNFGTDDNLPLDLIESVNNSGVAKKALKKHAEYIGADGFVSDSASFYPVNTEVTADKLLSKIALAFSYFNGAFIHVSRTFDGKVHHITLFPNQKVRRGLDRVSWFYNETIGSDKYDSNKWVKYRDFVGTIATNEQLLEIATVYEANGEIYYCNDGNLFDSAIYSLPDYLSSIEDLKTSSELAKMDYESVLNGFVLGGTMTYIGVNETEKDESNKTERDHITDRMRSFTGLDKNKDGYSSRFGLMLNFVSVAEQVPVYTGFDPKPILEASTQKREVIERAVCRLWSVHPVLLGYESSSTLGNDNAINQAMSILKQAVNPIQRLITQMFVDFYGNEIDWTISEFGLKSTQTQIKGNEE